ncbi:glycoside hydrolase family 3 protein [Annulohypoxylon truncatum]|uniref:glycoside hydrolase family 3 protein n=1 Tax=Annulohypoxylon truncatum TaxID=327061 RepID=UPI0020088768|nr:glycoside hydrolase family 3 protein [Annulohypoxylon truncatum]KAI1211555.1 glycoside hydrolase family 3 protein [Annulohypoxylon truncatum]
MAESKQNPPWMSEGQAVLPQQPQKRSWWNNQQQRFPILQKKRGVALLITIMVLPLFGLLGLLALRNRGGGSSESAGGTGSTGLVTDDTYFYGQSEPVYPSPMMTGTGAWADAYTKALNFVKQLTTEEKVSLASGLSSSTGSSGTVNGCSGNIDAIPRMNFSGFCLNDAGQGVRGTDFVSGFPSGLHVAASWNKVLARSRAESMGLEFRVKGVQIHLGPVVGPLGRVVRGGRNWEGFSPDPYLSGALVSETVQGIQSQGVITSTKHFIGNEQETNRQPTGDVESFSANIDDQTLHELYLWPFQDAVKAGTANVMCSYNRVNNSYACANSKLQNGILKTELGFQGAITSDWGAMHAGVASAEAGMDMVMPNSDLWGDNLTKAVKNGSVTEDRINDMATRIMAGYYQLGQDQGFPDPGIGMPADLSKPHDIVDARNISSQKILLDGAIEGHVLLKNRNNTLPLKKPKILSIFGYSAKNPDQWNYKPNGGVAAWTFGGESSYLGRDTAAGFSGHYYEAFSDIAPNGTIFSGGGSGAVTPASVSAPFDALNARALDDRTAVFWDFFNPEPDVTATSDPCLVIVNAFASEGYDRPGLRDDYTDGLIRHVADRCNNTIVVFHNAGVRLVDQWIDHPNVTALIFAHLPGEASGRALVSLLYGESNPSGKLPFTIARNESDYEAFAGPDLPSGQFEKFPQSNFSVEGVYIDYRHFDLKNITPRYEFGFGLSYTTFEYSDLQVTKQNSTNTDEYPTGAIREGGQEDLWDVVATVNATIRNSGDVDGAEVAQLYVGIPNAPAKQLRGFEKPAVNSSATVTVGFELTRRDLSIWDVVAQKWRLQPGKYGVFVGGSSRNLPLTGTLTI